MLDQVELAALVGGPGDGAERRVRRGQAVYFFATKPRRLRPGVTVRYVGLPPGVEIERSPEVSFLVKYRRTGRIDEAGRAVFEEA